MRPVVFLSHQAWRAGDPPMVFTSQGSFICVSVFHSPVGVAQPGLFPVSSAIMKSAAVHILTRVLVWTHVFTSLRSMPIIELLAVG